MLLPLAELARVKFRPKLLNRFDQGRTELSPSVNDLGVDGLNVRFDAESSSNSGSSPYPMGGGQHFLLQDLDRLVPWSWVSSNSLKASLSLPSASSAY